MLVTLGTYKVKWVNNNVWFRCSVSTLLFFVYPPNKDCHLVPGGGHFPPAVMSKTPGHFLRSQKEIESKNLLAVKSPPSSKCICTAHCLSCDLRCISCWHFELIFADLAFLFKSLRILAPTPSLPFLGLSVGKYGVRWIFSTEFPSVWRCQLAAACRGGSRLQGCHGYPLAMPEALRLPSNH